MLNVLKSIENARSAEAFSRMFTGDRHCVKRMDLLFPWIELRIKTSIPIDTVVPGQYELKNSGNRS